MTRASVELDQAWAGVLATVRERQDWRGLAAVQSRPDLLALLVVWPNCAVDWRRPEKPPPRAGAWDLLWGPGEWLERTTNAVGEALGWEWERARAVVASAVRLQVVLPDGTLPRALEMAAQGLA